MSTPEAEDETSGDAFPETIGQFVVAFVALLLIWATASWIRKLSEQGDHGLFDGSIWQTAGTLAGGVVSYLVIFSLPMLVWRAGRAMPRSRYLRLARRS